MLCSLCQTKASLGFFKIFSHLPGISHANTLLKLAKNGFLFGESSFEGAEVVFRTPPEVVSGNGGGSEISNVIPHIEVLEFNLQHFY